MGEITPYIDVAQVVLYLFWIFFAGLIIYLLKENKREGYPLVTDRLNDRVKVQGWPAMPSPKTYKRADGRTFSAPNAARDDRPVAAVKAAGFFGAPLVPTGNPMLDGVGPGAYAMRADTPDLSTDGRPAIVPLRVATAYHVDARDRNPIGLTVRGADGVAGGVVTDAWVDRSESLLRYLEVDVGAGNKRLLPVPFVTFDKRGVNVVAILGGQFAAVPATKSPDQVTLLEEDRISAYYGAGTLYATPARQEPLL